MFSAGDLARPALVSGPAACWGELPQEAAEAVAAHLARLPDRHRRPSLAATRLAGRQWRAAVDAAVDNLHAVLPANGGAHLIQILDAAESLFPNLERLSAADGPELLVPRVAAAREARRNDSLPGAPRRAGAGLARLDVQLGARAIDLRCLPTRVARLTGLTALRAVSTDLGRVGAELLAALTACRRLEELELGGVGADVEPSAAARLAVAVETVAARCPLAKLRLGGPGNLIGAAPLDLSGAAASLTALELGRALRPSGEAVAGTLSALGPAPRLERLELALQPGGAALEAVARLGRLTALACDGGDLRDAALRSCLGASTALRSLDLSRCSAEPQLMGALARLSSLTRLDLWCVRGSLQDLASRQLAALTALRWFAASDCGLGPGVLPTLARLTLLEGLDLGGNRELAGGGQAVARLRALRALTSLNLTSCQLGAGHTGLGLAAALRGMPRLAELRLEGNPLPPSVLVDGLVPGCPLTYLEIGSQQPPSESPPPALVRLARLQHLTITAAWATAAGWRALLGLAARAPDLGTLEVLGYLSPEDLSHARQAVSHAQVPGLHVALPDGR